MPSGQAGQFISITSPLGRDALVLQKFTGQEGISQLFKFKLELISEQAPVQLESIIGQNVTVSLTLNDGGNRYFNGFVSEFAQTDQDSQFTYYQAQIVPWLWFLGHTSDSRIFQNRTIPEILMQIFQDFGFRDFKSALRGAYERHEVVVQYRETEFNFISRLMEKEGIFYFFEHEQGKHTLILSDNPAAHPILPATPTVSYQPGDGSEAGADVVTRIALKREWYPGRYAMNDYNFTTPSTSLEVGLASTVEVGGNHRYELYEHPGDYRRKAQGDLLGRIRMQEIESISQAVSGTSRCRALAAGYRFTLAGHSRQDLNRAYVVTKVQHQMQAGTDGTAAYTNDFMAIPDSVPFRPLRLTPQPVVRGPESGVVVGPKGEEIYVDEYGRVKVQFYWDREGKRDENSSGWIRVAQPWAGNQWGSLFIPRIGDEVLIEFVHGDLSRPYVTGSLYNGEDRPPYALPAGRTITTIKSHSSKGGGGSNELRFEDKKNSEEIYFHAQKNWRTVIENDEAETIGNNQTLQVGGNQNTTVGRAQTLTIGAACQVTVGAAMSERVGSDKQLEIGATLTETIGRDLKLTVGNDGRVAFGKNLVLNAGNGIAIETQKTVTISAADEVTLKCGQASVVLKKNGDISISGKEISVKASGDLVLKGQRILQN
jgi:type VI secretion system secreted protein VgrG